MLLGAGELGKEVLIALQRLSVETIEDRYDNAPGQQVAHHAHTITMVIHGSSRRWKSLVRCAG
jgi:phosphoribosylglycinamide formyltransferase 2